MVIAQRTGMDRDPDVYDGLGVHGRHPGTHGNKILLMLEQCLGHLIDERVVQLLMYGQDIGAAERLDRLRLIFVGTGRDGQGAEVGRFLADTCDDLGGNGDQ